MLTVCFSVRVFLVVKGVITLVNLFSVNIIFRLLVDYHCMVNKDLKFACVLSPSVSPSVRLSVYLFNYLFLFVSSYK